jgi:hypothetical protein
MITFLILIGPLPLLILYAVIRARLKRRKQHTADTQLPAPHEKPDEPEAPKEPNAFLRRFPLTTQLYLRQQWSVARFGFIASLWIFTVLLCGSLVPPFADKLPNADQRVWLSFVTGASVWGTGLPALIAIFAAVFASTGIIASSATFTRTRPIPLRVIFWGRMLPALAALLLAAAVSIGIAFSTLRIVYGPVWNSVPNSATANGALQHGLISLDDDETSEQAAARRLRWLAQNPTPHILASSVTTMTLSFSAFVLVFCQPFGASKTFPSGTMKWIAPITSFGVISAFHVLKDSSSTGSFLKQLSQLLFYNSPFQVPPPWRFLPVPIVLSIALLFLSERLYLRRDI